jgi:hypothetical protein
MTTPDQVMETYVALWKEETDLHQGSCAGVMRGSPEDEHLQIFLDAMEAVHHTGGHKHDRACLDPLVFVAHANTPAARDDKVHFIFRVGFLVVGQTGGPNGQSQAQQLAREEVFVGVDSWFAR